MWFMKMNIRLLQSHSPSTNKAPDWKTGFGSTLAENPQGSVGTKRKEKPQNFAKGAKLCATTAEVKAHRLKPVPRKPEAKTDLRLQRRATCVREFFMWGLPLQSWRDGVPFVEAGGMKNESLTSARRKRGRDVSYRTPPLSAFVPGG